MNGYSLVGEQINAGLRSGNVSDDDRRAFVGPLDQLTGNRLSQPVDVVRGVGYDGLPAEVDPSDLDALEGQPIRDAGFMSTTASTSPPGKFQDRPVLLQMHLPAGTRAARLDSFGSEFAAEREVLLARGTRYVVRRVYRERGRWVLDCEVLPDE